MRRDRRTPHVTESRAGRYTPSRMGKVVDLEAGKQRRTRRGEGQAPPRARSKTALVLGGGGFTGGVYEIGALRALDLLSVNRTVNEFDVYVGTSAGSFVASLAANGITPEEMMRVVNQQVPTPFRDIDLGTLLRPNVVEFARTGVMLPFKLARVARDARRPARLDLGDGPRRSASPRRCPRACTPARASSSTCARCSSDPDRTDDFRLLEHELYLAATDLDTCERIVFGANDWDDVPISTAVRASTALPMVYKPVARQGPRARRRRHRLDHQPRHRGRGGREVRRRRQPARALRQRLHRRRSRRCSARARAHVSDMGFPQIGYQAFKLLAYQRLHEMARAVGAALPGRRHRPDRARARRRADVPDVDHELHQPRRHRPPRLPVGDAQARRGLRRRFARDLRAATASRSPPRACARSSSTSRPRRSSTRAWRKILEQTTGALLRQSAVLEVVGRGAPVGVDRGREPRADRR